VRHRGQLLDRRLAAVTSSNTPNISEAMISAAALVVIVTRVSFRLIESRAIKLCMCASAGGQTEELRADLQAPLLGRTAIDLKTNLVVLDEDPHDAAFVQKGIRLTDGQH